MRCCLDRSGSGGVWGEPALLDQSITEAKSGAETRKQLNSRQNGLRFHMRHLNEDVFQAEENLLLVGFSTDSVYAILPHLDFINSQMEFKQDNANVFESILGRVKLSIRDIGEQTGQCQSLSGVLSTDSVEDFHFGIFLDKTNADLQRVILIRDFRVLCETLSNTNPAIVKLGSTQAPRTLHGILILPHENEKIEKTINPPL